MTRYRLTTNRHGVRLTSDPMPTMLQTWAEAKKWDKALDLNPDFEQQLHGGGPWQSMLIVDAHTVLELEQANQKAGPTPPETETRKPEYTTGDRKPLILADLRRLVNETAHLSPVTTVQVHRPDPGTNPAKHTTILDVFTGALATGRKFDGDLNRVGDIITQPNALDILAVGSVVTDPQGIEFTRGGRGRDVDKWYGGLAQLELRHNEMMFPVTVEVVASRERGMRKTSAKYAAQRLAAEEGTI